MLDFCRNLLIPVAALVVAVLLTGLAQGAFDFAFPIASAHIVGKTSVSTYASLVVFGALFLLMGAYVPHWLRTTAPLLWMLLPLAAVYLVAVIGQPYVYRCSPFHGVYVASCCVILSPFAVSALALIVGYTLYSGRAHVSGRAT
jgi:hypothetical protein